MAKRNSPITADSKRTAEAKQTTKQRKAARRFAKLNARKYLSATSQG